MKIKEMRKMLGLTQKEFASAYEIPMRTLQSWEGEERKCPAYVKKLLERAVLQDEREADV